MTVPDFARLKMSVKSQPADKNLLIDGLIFMCPVFVRGLKDSATQQVEYFYEKATANVKLAVAMAES